MLPEENLDPITRDVIRNYLYSAADTMAVTVVRTARSAVVKDGMDFSTAIFNSDGEQVAQGLTLPLHMGAMQPALDAVREYFQNDINPDDVFINNDPYEGGSHLPDIFLFKPIFYLFDLKFTLIFKSYLAHIILSFLDRFFKFLFTNTLYYISNQY